MIHVGWIEIGKQKARAMRGLFVGGCWRFLCAVLLQHRIDELTDEALLRLR